MKTLLACLVLVAALPKAAISAEPPLTVAVFDFQSTDEGVRDLGPKVSALLNATLSADARVMTVERAELDKALGEQELGLSGTIAPASAAKIGQLTGAQVLITGRVMKADNETLIIAKIISAETGRVFGATGKLNAKESLADSATALANSIAEVATKNAGVLVGKAETLDDLINKIKGGLPEGRRPTIMVHIPEQHIGRPITDPAAETELAMIFRECGFKVNDEKSAGRSDYALVGEAFSERGMQRGNLISCRARVEVKLRNLATGELVASDRQVSSGVDLGEHVAAKSALQNAARELAVRLVAKVKE
jgi:TolB-like protein